MSTVPHGPKRRGRPAKDRTRSCKVCGEEFQYGSPSQLHCSPKCAGESRRKRPRFIECQNCGRQFETGGQARKFCSRDCSAASQQKKRAVGKCVGCGREFEYLPNGARTGRHCSAACYNSHRHKPGTHAGWYGGQSRRVESRKCKQCGSQFEAPPWRKQNCCSLSCGIRYAKSPCDKPVIEQDPEAFIGLLHWVVRQYTDVRPLPDADEYQSAWLGLLEACKAYRGTVKVENFVISRMRNQILEDRFGKFSERQNRKSRGISVFSVSTRRRSDSWHPRAGDPSPPESAIGSELRDILVREVERMRSPMRQYASERLFRGLSTQEISESRSADTSRVSYFLTLARRSLMKTLRWSWDGVEEFADAADLKASRIVEHVA